MGVITRKDLRNQCGVAFGAESRTDAFVEQVIAKLKEVGIGFGQLYWTGYAGPGRKLLQLNAYVPGEKGSKTQRVVRLNSELVVVMSESKAGKPDEPHAFSQVGGDPNTARKQMGDYRN